MLCAPPMWLRIHWQDHMETHLAGTLEINTDEIDRRLIKGEEAHVSSCGGLRRRKCSRRDGCAVGRCGRYAGAGGHCHPRTFRRPGQHEHLQPNTHTRHADAIELIDRRACTDERTWLTVGRRSSAAAGRPTRIRMRWDRLAQRPELDADRAGTRSPTSPFG
jgi:hypothetical protein